MWRWNKARKKYYTSKFVLSVWFIQLSKYFYHTVRFTTNYLFNRHLCTRLRSRYNLLVYMCLTSFLIRHMYVSDVYFLCMYQWIPHICFCLSSHSSHTSIENFVYIYIYKVLYIYICIWLNNTDILCLHIFVFILLSRRIVFMVSVGYWLINLPKLIGSFVLSARSWAIISGMCIAKAMWPLRVGWNFASVKHLLFIKSMPWPERIHTKICRQRMFILFNQICINEEMLPKYT